jgi:hypothetical protein
MAVNAFSKNMWGAARGNGTGMEVQRADLWVVTFDEVVKHLKSLQRKNIPDYSEMSLYANTVSFPDTKTGAEAFYNFNTPVFFPTYDLPTEPVRITFHFDASEFDVGTPSGSKIYSFLLAWRQLVRIGRGDFGAEEGLLMSETRNATIVNNRLFVPKFRFDIPVHFLKGTPDATTLTPEQSETILLSKAWLSSVQLSEIGHANASALVSVTAQLYCESISKKV